MFVSDGDGLSLVAGRACLHLGLSFVENLLRLFQRVMSPRAVRLVERDVAQFTHRLLTALGLGVYLLRLVEQRVNGRVRNPHRFWGEEGLSGSAGARQGPATKSVDVLVSTGGQGHRDLESRPQVGG